MGLRSALRGCSEHYDSGMHAGSSKLYLETFLCGR
jgi:hypothetical protein